MKSSLPAAILMFVLILLLATQTVESYSGMWNTYNVLLVLIN